jgi:murein tripeptide amidase MpaA
MCHLRDKEDFMAIIVDTNFPGGAAVHVKFGAGDTIFFSAPIDGSTSDRSLWFYFRVRGAKGKTLHFTQQNMTHTLDPVCGAGYQAVRPVISEGKSGEFIRIPLEDTSFTPNPISFSFSLTPQSDETYVSFCFPYQYADLLRFVENHTKYLPMKFIGKTSEGRDYPVLLAGDDGNHEKKLIIVSARQHSGETSGSFVLEGFLKQYLSDDQAGRNLREKTVLLVLPMTNLDGVEQGRYGKDAPPIDFGRDWGTGTIHEELRAFTSFVDELLKKYQNGFYVDFHAPQPGGYSYIVPGRAGMVGKEGWKRTNQLIDLFEELTRERGVCRRQDLDSEYLDWSGENYRVTLQSIMTENYHFEGVCLENSYHTDCFGRYLYPDDWRFMGAQFCEAMRRIWFDSYDKPASTLETLEIMWDGWEMISLPKKVTINAKPGQFRAEAIEDGASVFFSDRHTIKFAEKGSYSLTCNGEAHITCYAYQNKNGKTALRSKPYTSFGKNETISLPFEFFAQEGFDSFRVIFNISSLAGSITVSSVA